MRSAILAVVLLLLVVTTSHAARFDTSFRFSTIETPHFSVHYHQGLEAVAQKAAVFAEEAHARLTDEFLWLPAEKTQLVLMDDSDFTNGMAITIPYNTVFLQVAPPSLISTLGEYDDWLRTLITHEYAHIITSDPARGYWKVTRAIFGKPLPWIGDPFTELMFLVTAPPNTFMPRWWHEGMATWSESQFTGQGRGKGTFFEMVYRTAVAENNVPKVDEINGDVPYWPNGDLPYMFGFRLQKYIADTYGKDALGQLPVAHSGRFPYFISTPPEEICGGRNYRELYADMTAAVRREQTAKIATLSAAPFTPLATISADGENLTNPRFSPDGSRIAFTRSDPNEHRRTVIADRTGRVVAQVRSRYSDGTICWSPDAGTIYFTQAEVNRGFDIYQDIYAYDIARDKLTRLTYQERLTEIDISPDGKTFAAVVNSRGTRSLALVDVRRHRKGERPRIIREYPLQRISSPHWSPDGRTICYMLRDNSGNSSLRLYDVTTGNERTVFSSDYTVEYPVWSHDGSSIFYISDETGVFNVFAYDFATARSYQVSHLLTGALQPDPSPDGRVLALSSYTSRGFKISEMALDRTKWSEKRGPSLPVLRTIPARAATGAAASTASPPSPAPADSAAPMTSATLTTTTTMVGSAAAVADPASPQPALTAMTAAAPATAPAAAGPDGTTAGATPAAAADVQSYLDEAPSQRYNPLKTLYPHFWLPRVSDDGSDKAVLGAFTAGADVLGYHSYALAVDYSSGRKRGYFDLLYQNNSFYPTLSLLAHQEPFLYTNLQQRGDYWELNRALTLEASIPINFLERRYLFNLGYQLLDQQALSPVVGDYFDGVRVFQGRRDNIFAGITFDDVLRYPWSISPEEGRTISFLYKRFDKALGSEQNLSEYSVQYEEFLRMPTKPLKHHVVYLRLSGAAAEGDLQYGQEAFQIGGVPSDLNEYPLRGYPSRFATGKYVATGTLEYRAPLFYPMRGPGTFPAFAEKIHGAVFVDAGEVWGDHNAFNGNNLKVGAGVEARADVTVGYWLKITPALGFAHGFDTGGENQIYLTVYLRM